MNQIRPLFKKTDIREILRVLRLITQQHNLKWISLIGFVFLFIACSQEQSEQVFIPAVKIDDTEAAATAVLTTEIFVPALQSEAVNDTRAANADVTFVAAKTSDGSSWTFSVTVAHPDSGWEDYADGWDVVLPDGTVIKPGPDSPFTRLLTHPHENEQPFTRSQSGIIIPADVTNVTVRAHDLVDGFGGQEVVVDLTAVSGENFSVER